MMNPVKLKVLEELLSHLSDSQGGDLKSLLDQSKAPMEVKGPSVDGMDEMEKPKGLSIEKVEMMGKPGVEVEPMGSGNGDEEMSDDELKELLSQYLK